MRLRTNYALFASPAIAEVGVTEGVLSDGWGHPVVRRDNDVQQPIFLTENVAYPMSMRTFCCISFELSYYYSLRRAGGGSTGVVREPRHRPLALVAYRTASTREFPPRADWSGL